jgi:hypothetical protein
MRRLQSVSLAVAAAAMMFASPAAAGPAWAAVAPTATSFAWAPAPLQPTRNCADFCRANYPTHYNKCMQVCQAGGGQ